MVQRKFNLYLARTAGMLSGARRVALLLAVMMLTTTAQTAWADSAFSGGDGSEDNPYKISSKADLDQLATEVNGGNGYSGKYFKLTANIEYDKSTENNFTPIGNNMGSFYGTFDGDGKTISGININSGDAEYQGIFGLVDGNVKNLVVSNCSIVGLQFIGVIAGALRRGTIENCHVGNDVTLSSGNAYNAYAGGIVGRSERGTIKGCTCAATITSTTVARILGGIVGATESGTSSTLTDNIFTGTITGNLGEYIGAIVGQNGGGTLTNNLYASTGFGGIGAEGSTTGADGSGARNMDWATQSNGNSEATAYIINDKAQLDLLAQRVKDGNDYSGKYFKLGADIEYDYTGLSATESNYTAIGDNSHQFAGHFDGDGHTISGIRIYKGGKDETNHTDDYQGLFGKISSTAEVKNVTLANATITGYKYIGGIVGYSDRGNVTDCHVLSDVTFPSVQSYAQYHGGIVGYNDRVTTGNSDHGIVTGCTSAAAFKHVGSVYNTYNIGGIVGYNQLGTVSQCIYLGTTLQGDHYVGAIVGYNNMATLTNCYFTSTTIQGKDGSNPVQTLDNAESAVGYNREGAVTNCGLAHKVTLGEGITLGAAATEHGLLTVYGNVVAMGYNDGTSTTFYSKSGNVITLGNYSGTTPEGYNFGGYSAKDADNGDVTVTKTSGGYTFTMPAKDVTVSAIFTAIPWSGRGDNADDPYIILYPSQLDLLAAQVNAGNNYEGKFFKLGDNIEYDGTENNFTPIGKSNYPFYGTFDGDGNTISGININSGDQFQGIFGFVDGTVKNLVVSNCSIAGRHSTGVIAGQLRRGTIENCHVENNVTLSGCSYIGGIVGISEVGTIKGCTSAATITGTFSSGIKADNLGGIVGATYEYASTSSTLTDNIFTGTITGDLKGYIGAIVGQNSNSTLTNNLYTSTGFGGIGAEGSTTGADGAGARKALTISAATDVTITPTGAATTYDVSGITVYADNKGMKYNNTLYAGATDAVKLTLAYSGTGTVPEGYIRSYSDGSGKALPENSDGSYTLTMPAADVTVSAFVSLKPLDGVKYIDANGQEQTRDGVIILTGDETTLGEAGTASSPKEVWYICNKDLSYSSTLTSANYCNVNIILADEVEMSVESSSSNAMYFSGSLGIYGQSTGTNRGKLTATSAGSSYGIRANNDVIISSAEVTATGYEAISTDGNISITGGKVTANGTLKGIRAYGTGKNITISSAEVTATGYEAISTDRGDVNITDGSTVTAKGSYNGIRANNDVVISGAEVTATTTGNSGQAIYSSEGGISISGAEVTATATGTVGEAIYADRGDVNITDGSTVTAKGSNFGIWAKNDVTISSAEVTATATGTTGQAIYSMGGGVIITDGKVTANGTDIGISAKNDVTISGAEVTATATSTVGEAIYSSGGGVIITGGKVTVNGTNIGIWANNDVTISSAEVTATATDDTSGQAIYSSGGGVSITGGKVTVNGTSKGIFAMNDVTISSAEVTATATGTFGQAIYSPYGGVIITGGKVTVNGTSCGIHASNGVELDWTNATDFIFASSYEVGYGNAVIISNGKRFVAYTVDNTNPESPVENGSAIIAGIVSDLATIAGKMLRPLDGYCVAVSEGLNIVNRTPAFTIGSASYYNIAENDNVTITPNAGYELNTMSYNNTEITPVNNAYTFAMPAADVTVSATLTPIVYSITYNGVDGATFATANPTTYTIESAAITLNNPTREGYVFAGWYDNEGFTGNAITAIATGSTGAKTFYARWKIITAISVQNTSLELKVLDEVATGATLTNVVSSTAVTDENVTLTYTSSNSSVATIDNGTIKAIAPGTATITASFAGNDKYVAAESKTISVTVSFKDASVSVSDGENEITSLNLYVDDTYTIVPTTTPEGLAVTYAADGSGVVSVDENGVVTALKAGTGTIVLKVGGDGVYAESSKTVTVNVSKVPTAISLNEPPFGYNFNVLDEVNTGATLTNVVSSTAVTDENVTLTYTSSNSNVAKVEDGKIKALAAGTATITVSFAGNDKYAAAESTISVTVSLNDASVSVDNNAFDLLVGEIQAIAATTTPEGLDVTYTADGSGVVSVDEDGVVIALKAGTGTVTVSVGGDGVYAASSTTVTVTVSSYEMANLFSGSNEWTSYVADRNLGVPAGLTAYIITALGAETATATSIDYIPQGEPVLLRRSDKTVNSYAGYIYSGSASISAGNLLKVASATSQPTAFRDYVLYQDAFVLVSGGTLATGKVFLPMTQNRQSRAASRTIVIDDQTTRIDGWSMDNGQSSDAWYDLQGRRIDGTPTKKGVYIYNGKKVAIK